MMLFDIWYFLDRVSGHSLYVSQVTRDRYGPCIKPG